MDAGGDCPESRILAGKVFVCCGGGGSGAHAAQLAGHQTGVGTNFVYSLVSRGTLPPASEDQGICMNQAISASAAADAESVLYASIRALITSARNTIARGVDLVQVHTNFEIGRHIVEYEQQGETRATYGQELLNRLADRLTAEFGKGFGRSNIAYSRSFYLAYRERRAIVQTASGLLPSPFQIIQTASGQSERPFSLSWSHYVFLLGIKKADERSFYEIEATFAGAGQGFPV